MTTKGMVSSEKQRKIIRELTIQKGQRFSQLAQFFEPEDKFAYHIKHLVKHGYVEKVENKYFLTKQGLNQISSFDWETLQSVELSINFIGVICFYKDKILLKKIKSSSFHNWYRFHSQQTTMGLTAREFIKKHLLINTSAGTAIFHSTHHRIFHDSKGSFVWDSFLNLFTVNLNYKDYLYLSKKSKNYLWFTREEISNLLDKFPEIDLVLDQASYQPFYEYILQERPIK